MGGRGRTSPSRARHGDGAKLVGQPSLFERPVRGRWRRGEPHPARNREGGMSTDDVIAAVFGRAADGHLAARVEDIAFIAIPVRSEEHTSELQSLMRISYAVFCLKKKTIPNTNN